MGQFGPNFGQARPTLDQTRPMLIELGQFVAQIWPNLTPYWPELAGSKPNLESNNCSATVRQVWVSPQSPGIKFQGGQLFGKSWVMFFLSLRRSKALGITNMLANYRQLCVDVGQAWPRSVANIGKTPPKVGRRPARGNCSVRAPEQVSFRLSENSEIGACWPIWGQSWSHLVSVRRAGQIWPDLASHIWQSSAQIQPVSAKCGRVRPTISYK